MSKLFSFSYRFSSQSRRLLFCKRLVILLSGMSLAHCSQQPVQVAQPSQPVQQVARPVDHPVESIVPQATPIELTQRFSIVGTNLPIKDIFTLMASEAHINIDIHPSINSKVSISLQQETIKNILDRICRQANLIYRFENNVLIVEPDLPYLKNYKIDYVNIERDTKGGISVTNQLASAQSGIKNATASTAMQLNNSSTS